MIHHFYGLGGAIPYAKQALAEIGAEVREAFALLPADGGRRWHAKLGEFGEFA